MSGFLTEQEKDNLLEGMDYNKAMSVDVDVLEELKAYLESKEDFDKGKYSAISNALTEKQSMENMAAQAQERLASQEELKATFELPKDYSALFDDHRANDEIKLLIGQIIDQMTNHYELVITGKDEENLAAIRELREKYEDAITSAQHERDSIKKQLEEATKESEDLRIAINQLNDEKAWFEANLSSVKSELAQATLEKQDAETKRDAAMREVESLKAQIVELEQMANKPKASAGLKFSLTSGIEDKPIKSSREIMMEKFGLIPPKTGGEPTGNSFPVDTETGTTDELADAAGTQPDTTDQVSEEDFRDSLSDMERGSSLVQDATAREGSVGNNEEVSPTALKARIEAIEARLSAIERHPNFYMSA